MLVPRWVLHIGWAMHRGLYAVSGGRIGVQPPKGTALGRLRLHTVGRTTGMMREAFLYYVDVDGDPAVVASNAGEDEPPAWYGNLQANPDAEIDLAGDHRLVRAREASPPERSAIYARFAAANPDYAEYERRTRRTIPVVILGPR